MSRVRELLQSGVAPAEHSDAVRRVARGASSALGALQAEMLREMASSPGRASERISGSLAALADLGRHIDELEAQGAARGAVQEAVDLFNDEREGQVNQPGSGSVECGAPGAVDNTDQPGQCGSSAAQVLEMVYITPRPRSRFVGTK